MGSGSSKKKFDWGKECHWIICCRVDSGQIQLFTGYNFKKKENADWPTAHMYLFEKIYRRDGRGWYPVCAGGIKNNEAGTPELNLYSALNDPAFAFKAYEYMRSLAQGTGLSALPRVDGDERNQAVRGAIDEREEAKKRAEKRAAEGVAKGTEDQSNATSEGADAHRKSQNVECPRSIIKIEGGGVNEFDPRPIQVGIKNVTKYLQKQWEYCEDPSNFSHWNEGNTGTQGEAPDYSWMEKSKHWPF